MSEKKMISRSIAIALGIICVILVAALGAVTFMCYSPTVANSVTNLQSKINQLQMWLEGNETLLSQWETWLDDNITYYNSQIANLQNQLSHLTEPTLGFLDLTVEDNRTTPETPYLHISGIVRNFGIEQTGRLSFLYVEAYQNNGTKAMKSMESLGNISGQSSIDVDLNFYYNGSAITSWRVGVGVIMVI